MQDDLGVFHALREWFETAGRIRRNRGAGEQQREGAAEAESYYGGEHLEGSRTHNVALV
mgnify:FL=1